jgi:hypothetical protein
MPTFTEMLPLFTISALSPSGVRLSGAFLLDEMATRNVPILDQPDAFGPVLESLRGAFRVGSEDEKRDRVVARHP